MVKSKKVVRILSRRRDEERRVMEEEEGERQGSSSSSSSNHREEFMIDEPARDLLTSSKGSRSRLTLLANELRLIDSFLLPKISGESFINSLRDIYRGSVVHPNTNWYQWWENFICLWALYSCFFTPFEFAFFVGLPDNFFFLDIAGQIAFLIDIVLKFFVAYRDSQTYRMVYQRTSIALRYLKSSFLLDFLACLPWDMIFKASGRKEEVRYLLWIRLIRVRKLMTFLHMLERDIRVNYLFARILKLIFVELYSTHTAACIFYYLATLVPPAQEGYTWIGSLKMGDFSYSSFREINLWKRYTTSLYFSIVTMATVGYGDIHAVNIPEMIFVMVYVSFDMVLGAYLIGNITALLVKGSKTEGFRDKMRDVMKYMNRNRLGRDLRNQIKGHLRLQYESSYTKAVFLQDIPVSLRAKIFKTLYMSIIENVPLFKGCSLEFINQIVIRVQEEFFFPGEVILEQGNVVDQLYFVCDGMLEEVGIGKDGSDETISLLEASSTFGEISILCNIPQPYTVRVCELCRVLRIDKQSLTNILEIYFHDGKKVLSNILEGKDPKYHVKQVESDLTSHIGKQEAELATRVNTATHNSDLNQLRNLIRAGAAPNKSNYDGGSPLETFEKLHQHVRESQNEEGINGKNLSSQTEGDIWCQTTSGSHRGNVFGYGSTQQASEPSVTISPCCVQLPSQSSQTVTIEMLQSILENIQQNVTANMRMTLQMNEMFAQWTLQNFGVTPPSFQVDPTPVPSSQFQPTSTHVPYNSDHIVEDKKNVEDDENDN
ncbi:hypothetical protein Dimus_033250 [Dionaea muscipula]